MVHLCTHYTVSLYGKNEWYYNNDIVNSSVLSRNFISGDNVTGHLKKWGHLRKSGDIVGKMMGQ